MSASLQFERNPVLLKEFKIGLEKKGFGSEDQSPGSYEGRNAVKVGETIALEGQACDDLNTVASQRGDAT